MTLNILGKEIPDTINGKKLMPYNGPFEITPSGARTGKSLRKIKPNESKICNSIKDAIVKTGLKDGMTISFHHHFRNGDTVVLQVLEVIEEMGIKDLVLAPSSLASTHDPIVKYLETGMIRRIETSGLRGELGRAVSAGVCKEPAVIRSHGGRARAVESGELKIDVAFLGVPACDDYGNANGFSGESICGALGYAIVDSKYAENVVLISDNIVPYPCSPISIEQVNVDYVVKVNHIGDGAKISSGAARVTKDPRSLLIAESTVDVIVNSPYFKDGFSMQTGVGNVSIAVTQFIGQIMKEKDIKASFALGGIGDAFVKLHEEGYIDTLIDTQSLDLAACKSIKKNPKHVEIDTGFYANPHNGGAIVNKLDVVILSALEIDKNFHVNTITGSNGEIRGAVGGHQDTAAGAKLAIMVAPLVRGRLATIVDSVNTINTPGETVDVVVTEYGVAVNPRRKDLIEKFEETNIVLKTMEELAREAEAIVGKAVPVNYTDEVVAVIEYRDGTIIDTVKKLG
ncbi:citrate lyase subunit alpha [Clostridium sp. DL1XJH146]